MIAGLRDNTDRGRLPKAPGDRFPYIDITGEQRSFIIGHPGQRIHHQ